MFLEKKLDTLALVIPAPNFSISRRPGTKGGTDGLNPEAIQTPIAGMTVPTAMPK
jgi:hypothetical protein